MCELVDDELLEKYSVDSLEYSENPSEPLKYSTVTNEKPIRSCIPFRLHEEGQIGKRIFEFEDNWRGEKDKLLWNCEIDETALTRKGLQLNEDGSFSKSPRDGRYEDLPFVMSAPRIALIRRRKREGKKKLKEIMGNFEATDSTKKGRNREVTLLEELSRLKADGNLTDSMKEALYNKYRESELENQIPAVKNLLENFKKEMNEKESQKREVSFVLSKCAKKNLSHLHLPTIEKPLKLSYFQRYQKKVGFDPKSISLKGQKRIEDTVRSKFGDSSRDTLSDVSSQLITIDDEENEDEELFYQRLMTEKGLKNPGGDFSERSFLERCSKNQVERKKEVKITKGNSKRSGKGSPKCISGSVSSGRKSGHSCCHEPLPKAELVSRAKAYGNLANTRNIVKMQMKTFRRDWECREPPGVGKCRQKCDSFLPPLKDERINPKGRRKVV